MKKPIFRGAGVAIITPFTEDGINFDELGRIIEDQIAHHTDAIVIAGTSGEASTMTEEEHKEVIKYAVEKTAHRIPVIAGTGSNDTKFAIELSQYAESVGVDAVLVVTPYYNKCTQHGLIAHYKAIASAINIPIVLYHIPSRTGMSISIPTFVELAKIPNIVAVKEASGNLSHIVRLKAAVGDDLVIYSGDDDQILPILSVGGQGVISVLSNVDPQGTHDMCQAYFDGDTAKATKMQLDYMDLIDALFCETNPIPAKVAMRKLGWNAGPLRMPLCEMTPEHEKQLEDALRNHGLIK